MKTILHYFSKRLKGMFGVPIHKRHSSQRRTLPSISLKLESMSIKRELVGRLWIDVIISAVYLPKDGINQFDLELIKAKLIYAMERLPEEDGRFFSAITSQAKVNDGAVIGTAHYRIPMVEMAIADAYMMTLSQAFVTTDEAWEEKKKGKMPNYFGEPAEPSNPSIGYDTEGVFLESDKPTDPNKPVDGGNLDTGEDVSGDTPVDDEDTTDKPIDDETDYMGEIDITIP